RPSVEAVVAQSPKDSSKHDSRSRIQLWVLGAVVCAGLAVCLLSLYWALRWDSVSRPWTGFALPKQSEVISIETVDFRLGNGPRTDSFLVPERLWGGLLAALA